MEKSGTEKVTNRVFTIPNLITLIRLCLVPTYIVFLIQGFDVLATLLFAIAACTDWIDGQVARKTGSISKLGQLLDPAVDRILIISCVISLFVVGRLPFWIIFVVSLRDFCILVLGSYLLRRYDIRVSVILLGKVATAFLFIGFVGLLLNWPLVPGLDFALPAWLPGFNHEPCSWGIIFVYFGMAFAYAAVFHYILVVRSKLRSVRSSNTSGVASGGRKEEERFEE